MDELNIILNKIIKEKGGSVQQYRDLMDSIAFHESAGTLDPKLKQYGGGPGRGKYQFETGIHEGGITAANRTKQYYEKNNIPVPEWLQKATSANDLDVSNLSSEQQDILFLGNMRMHPKANFSNYINGKESKEDFWANYHWAGLPKHRNKRIESFNNSMNNYSEKKKNTAQPVPVSSDLEGYPNRGNLFFNGGAINKSYPDKNLNSYDVGGRHEVNPNGGIPQGIGSNGKMNTVEEGETSFNIDGNKFIFSDRINLNGEIKSKPSINKYLLGGDLNTDPNPTKPKSDINKLKTQSFNWYLNPETNKRLKSNLSFLGKDPSKSESMISSAIDNIRGVNVEHTDHDDHTEGEYGGNTIQIHKPGLGKDKVLVHELTHAGGLDKTLSNYIRQKYGSPFTNYSKNLAEQKGYSYNPESYQYEKEGDKSYSPLGLMQNTMSPYKFDSEKSMMDYLNNSEGGELYPRFQEMRNFLGVNPGQEITDEHIKQLQSNKDMQFMFKYYKPEVIKDILNTVASNNTQNFNNIAAFGGFINTLNLYPDRGKLTEGPGDPRLKLLKSKDSKKLNEKVDEVKRINREREKYFNPEIKDVTSGDWKQDFLYKNDWLLDFPIIGDKIKNKAKQVVEGTTIDHEVEGDVDEFINKTKNNKASFTTGSPLKKYFNSDLNFTELYFGNEKNIKKSEYKPSSDYLEFLPSYSMKRNFDEIYNKSYNSEEANMSDYINYSLKNSIDLLLDENKDFFKNKKTIYKPTNDQDESRPLIKLLGINLGGYKEGMAWDKELNLPYISISDAWDFEPEHYASKYNRGTDDYGRNYVQASLLHKVGKPFKVYDRFYFNPETKKYITDSEIEKLKNKKKE